MESTQTWGGHRSVCKRQMSVLVTAVLLLGKVRPWFTALSAEETPFPATLPPIARVGLSERGSLTGFLLVSGSKSNLVLLICVFSFVFVNVWMCGCVHGFAYLWARV